MKRRQFIVLLGAGSALLALDACGGGADGSAPDGAIEGWTVPAPTFVAGSGQTFDLASTLPATVAPGGTFEPAVSGNELPSGMTLSTAGVLSVGSATAGSTMGVVFSYTEPGSTRIESTPTTITVLPAMASGEVTLIGSNTAVSDDVRPQALDSGAGTTAQMTAAQFSYATMEAFGSGTFMPGVGSSGSWVMIGGGGHGAPPVFDALIFDFATAKWRTEPNAHGVPNYTTTQSADQTKTTLAPDYEVAGLPAGDHVPWTSQVYCHLTGVGTKVIFPFRSYIGAWTPTSVGYVGSYSSHYYDVATRQYGRIVSTGSATPQSYPNDALGAETTGLLDPVLNRLWIIRTEMGNRASISYLDLSTWTWGSVTPAANVLPATGYSYLHALLHDDGAGHRCIFIFNDGFPDKNWVLDLDHIENGWTQVNTVGSVGFTASRWSQYPVDRCHYCFKGVGQMLAKVTPPPYPFTGDWTLSEVAHGGADLPQLVNLSDNNGKHYTRFMYVPALACFAWIAGGATQVALWKP